MLVLKRKFPQLRVQIQNKIMEELYWVIGVVGFWLLLQLVILPKLGVDT